VSNNASHIDFDQLAKYLSNECTEAELAEVETWLSEKPENRTELEQLQLIWSLAAEQEIDVDVINGWNKVSSQISELPLAKTSQTRNNILSLRIAAGIALLVISALGIWLTSDAEPLQLSTTAEPMRFEFEDGSVVNLAANSEITYPEHFEDSDRTISMKGQAFFEISKNANRPFIIETTLGNVTVVGTAFEVNTNAAKKELVVEVEEGIVEVATTSKKEKQRVTAGQKCTVNAQNNEISLDSNLPADAFYWNNRTLKFKRTELANVVQTLRDLFQIDIVIEGENIQGCKLTATFVNEGADTIVEVIAATLKIELRREGTTYVFSGTGC